MPRQLIINADDFGLTPGVNRAIAELHQASALTSATLMATGAAFDDAVAIGDCERAARAEIILHVDDDQSLHRPPI